ncbi:MAG TPA: methyltransferase domain-containing protein [Actinobacteria bacterium]|nr:methyltransferase domain-containing protein [Actinomycetota bacterium]
MPTAEDAAGFPTGDLLLVLCESCGFIQNEWFEPALVDYSQAYEESQAHSPRFMEFATEIVDGLIQDFGIHNKTVLDIGCGKGSFVALMAKRGQNRGIGIDPTIAPERLDRESAELVELISGYFDESSTLTADLIACRHTLEHIPDVAGFTRLLAGALKRTDGATLFIEVPDVLRVLREGAFWDIYYEHCSYFTLGSLGRLIQDAGLSPTDLRLGFDDQYVLAYAVTEGGDIAAVDDLDQSIEAAERFSTTVAETIERWNQALAKWEGAGQRVVVWGASSKAVSFLTTLEEAHNVVAAVDINPYKQNQFLAGTHQQVLSPSALADIRPDVVVIMNPIYEAEITADLKSMGLNPTIQLL